MLKKEQNRSYCFSSFTSNAIQLIFSLYIPVAGSVADFIYHTWTTSSIQVYQFGWQNESQERGERSKKEFGKSGSIWELDFPDTVGRPKGRYVFSM